MISTSEAKRVFRDPEIISLLIEPMNAFWQEYLLIEKH